MAQPSAPSGKVMLISIDGYGVLDTVKGNAIKNARTPNMDKLSQFLYTGKIQASGLHVGLPEGLMGNSEVGHLTIGSGRVVFQDLVRINLAISKHELAGNKKLQDAFAYAKEHSSRVHLLGLVSDGGVHSHIEHFKAFLAEAKKQVPQTYVHFFADGRDTPPSSAVDYIKDLQNSMQTQGYGSIATVMGRYYAMDRDKRWERVAVAYDALVGGKGEEVKSDQLVDAVRKRYEQKETDEFLKPLIVDRAGLIQAKDVMIFMNFRSDRMREIVEVFGLNKAAPFDLSVPRPAQLHVLQMTRYNEAWTLPVLFPPVSMDNVLAEVVSKHGLRQFHTAETEKYAHVTFFFNGGREVMFAQEERQMVPSPKVATYDLQPEMNVHGVGDSVVAALKKDEYALVVCNLAPPDMVGHTGKYDAAVKAVEATDAVIGQIWEACLGHDYTLVITADHGNAEEMEDEQGNPKTSHTTNPVPLIVAGSGIKDRFVLDREDGGLCDVAPTVLDLMNLPIPEEMTGRSMLRRKPLP